ncbi:MAG: hypothetical protein KBT48_08010 [Firmicutes bacterium]|nr:hypothetical protein [Bacillota bacterium]
MEKDKLKNKIFFFGWIGAMCGTLILIAYAFFLRNINVDVTNQLAIEYEGENGVATVEVYYNGNDLNQRTQEFLESCTYRVEPGYNLSNGDVIKIITEYDENIAREYNFKPINVEKEIKVSGLYNKYERYQDIDEDYKEDVFKAEDDFVKAHTRSIYKEMFPGAPTYQKVSRKVVYKGFLDGIQDSTRDRLVEIVRLDYTIEVEKEIEVPKEIEESEESSESEDKEEETPKEEAEDKKSEVEMETKLVTVEEVKTIYYLVTLPGINEGKEFNAQDIFGEKAYLSEDEMKEQNYESYIDRVYKGKYNTQTIERVIIEPGLEK